MNYFIRLCKFYYHSCFYIFYTTNGFGISFYPINKYGHMYRFMIVNHWCWPQINRRIHETSYDIGPFRLKIFRDK